MADIDLPCPKCKEEMILFSNHVSSKEYYCRECKQFLRVPRPDDFYPKSPFKSKVYLMTMDGGSV